jgi:peroxiredoxin
MVGDLKGRAVPDVDLPMTFGGSTSLARLRGVSVVFIYPWTGRQGHENPEGWDDIEGAHGSTPQALEYNKMLPQFAAEGAAIFGLSSLRPAWQLDFAQRNQLKFALLSDAQEMLATALGLEWFWAGARAFLRRRTLIVRNGVVMLDRQTIAHPEDDAGQTLALLRVLQKP